MPIYLQLAEKLPLAIIVFIPVLLITRKKLSQPAQAGIFAALWILLTALVK